MKRRLGVAVVSLAVAFMAACAPSREPLPQDEFLADGVRVRIPPPSGLMRMTREEGTGKTHPHEFSIAQFRRGNQVFAMASLPGHLKSDSAQHLERLETIRMSWTARWLEPPAAVEREGRARLEALYAGHKDSADWRPEAPERAAMLAVRIHEEDAILRANAVRAADRAATVWQVDAFVFVRGRVLHLFCEDRSGGTLLDLETLRLMTLVWIAQIREANRPGARHGRIHRG